jgi:hypothetical protein
MRDHLVLVHLAATGKERGHVAMPKLPPILREGRGVRGEPVTGITG